jgi:hypothetical protein
VSIDEKREAKSYNFMRTMIQNIPLVYVSSAAIHYDEIWGERYQYETWIFSDAPDLRTNQWIHGSSSSKSERLENKSKKFNRRISKILLKGASK